MRRRVGGAGLGLGILLIAGAAAAQQMSEGMAMATAVRYHEAARAFELCGGKALSAAEHDKLAMAVSHATGGRLSIGQSLNAVRESRANMDQRVTAGGCKDPLVADALRFFEQVRPQLR
jgi:hypothetical protein